MLVLSASAAKCNLQQVAERLSLVADSSPTVDVTANSLVVSVSQAGLQNGVFTTSTGNV